MDSAIDELDARVVSLGKGEVLKVEDLVDAEISDPQDGDSVVYESESGKFKNKKVEAASTWTEVKNKPFESVGEGLTVEDNVLKSNGGGASTWSEVSGKPFSSIGTGLTVENDVLKATGGGTGGTTNYNDLDNKPTLNNKELVGDKSLNLSDIIGKPYPTDIKDNTIVLYRNTYSGWVFSELKSDDVNAHIQIKDIAHAGDVQLCLDIIGTHITNLENTVGQANDLLEVALYGES